MARELHDHAGQTLVALDLNFSELLEIAKDRDPKIVALVVESRRLSDDLSKEIRTLSYLLHPPLLDEAGLGSALQWYVEGFSQRSGIVVELELPEYSSRLSKELELGSFSGRAGKFDQRPSPFRQPIREDSSDAPAGCC